MARCPPLPDKPYNGINHKLVFQIIVSEFDLAFSITILEKILDKTFCLFFSKQRWVPVLQDANRFKVQKVLSVVKVCHLISMEEKYGTRVGRKNYPRLFSSSRMKACQSMRERKLSIHY